MLGFKVSKDRLTVLLEANGAGDFKLKAVLIYHAENSKALKNDAKPTLPVLCKWNHKAWMTAHLFITWFTEYLNSLLRLMLRNKKKKNPFKISLFLGNVPGRSRALMVMYNDINVVFMSANTSSILQPMDQGVISTFKSYYLRNTLCKACSCHT